MSASPSPPPTQAGEENRGDLPAYLSAHRPASMATLFRQRAIQSPPSAAERTNQPNSLLARLRVGLKWKILGWLAHSTIDPFPSVWLVTNKNLIRIVTTATQCLLNYVGGIFKRPYFKDLLDPPYWKFIAINTFAENWTRIDSHFIKFNHFVQWSVTAYRQIQFC